MSGENHREMFDRYQHELKLQVEGAAEFRSGAVASGGALLAVVVVLTALNLRPAATSVGQLLGELQRSLNASATWAGVLTTVPVLCFAFAGLGAPWLSRKIGLNWTISIALVALTAGLVVRVLGGRSVLIGGTLVASAGIALINVLIPVVIMGSFPARVALMTGVYTAALQGGAALGFAVTPTMDEAFGGWRPALGAWSVLAALALAVWVLAARRYSHADDAEASTVAKRPSLLRNRVAWTVTLFFACQGFVAYVVLSWLPEVLIDNKLSAETAGLLAGFTAVIPVPISLLASPLAAGRTSQSGWIVGLSMFGIAGIVGLIVAPGAAPLLWCTLVGVGLSVFSLALAVIALRARDPADTARLSGMAQGFGYLLAAAGPFLFGLLRDLTGGWTVPWILTLAVCCGQLATGALAGRNRYV